MRTTVFASLFALYAYVQPFGYRRAYPTLAERLAFARSFANNVGLRLFYGEPHDVAAVNGYAAWRVGGTLAIAAAAYGLLAAIQARRAEEDAGRAELVLAGTVSRRSVGNATVAAIAAGTFALWLAELAGFALAGMPLGGSAYLALATASVIPVCAGIGALAGEIAPTRQVALELGGALVGVAFVLRVVADTVRGVAWLRWATPLGWAEELRPFAGPRPFVLLLPVAATVLLGGLARHIFARRDIGTGVLPVRDSREPDLRLLSTPARQALRGTRGTIVAWIASLAVFDYVLGVVSNSISSADIPRSTEKQIAKLGAGSITTPTGYLGFVFIFVVLAVSIFACVEVGAVREEEASQRLETLLTLPLGRAQWLAGRMGVAAAAAVAVALTAGFAAWAGATSAGTHVSLARLLEAGANALPTAALFLGLAALLYAVVPRASTALSYALVTITFVWQLVGALLSAPHRLLEATPFAHVGLVPAQPFRLRAALVMVAIGAAAVVAALRLFGRRDLLER